MFDCQTYMGDYLIYSRYGKSKNDWVGIMSNG